ncbi:NAD(P)-binding protein [Echria macrotheca]|uniref:NAD(P)-binding protein n=1 Tax=Echria macrotheca TaxID=438768 RepID=A0AAJ0BKJ0_9PEZI|nr:NAD(P)-binding protein [Echria macrotheca]
MALPTTQKKWIINGTQKGLDELQYTEGPVPKVDDYSVLVKLHAASINYRDILIPTGNFPFSLKLPVVGGSDGAGEVIDIGARVTRWKKGDRVATLFNPGHQSGPLSRDAFLQGGFGGTIDGTFQEYAVFEETALVRLAANLSYVEGASLSDAAVTAWNALYGLKPLKPGEWVLVQGTGGVSLFAAQFAKAGGGRVIATTSSPAKAEILTQLGVDHVILYPEDPNWGVTAKNLTPNHEGVEHIVEVVGADTMHQSLQAVKLEGVISVIGLIGGRDTPDTIAEAVRKICTLRGVHVGSRVQMEEMMAAIEANKIQPVVDKRLFHLEELRDALEYLVCCLLFHSISIPGCLLSRPSRLLANIVLQAAQRHVGKVVIKIV